MKYIVYWFAHHGNVILARNEIYADHFHEAVSKLSTMSAPNGCGSLTLIEGPEIISGDPLKEVPPQPTSVITVAEQPLINQPQEDHT